MDQKKTNLVNVVCERPLTWQANYTKITNTFLAYVRISCLFALVECLELQSHLRKF